MRVFAVTETEVKGFMNHLLRDEWFDAFEVRGVEVSAFTRFEISGAAARSEEADTRRFCTWAMIKPYVMHIIKTDGIPRSLKIVFACSEAASAAVHPNASALSLNMVYENGAVTFTTATAQRIFSMDKTLDTAWDTWVTKFFARHGVPLNEVV